MDLQTPISAANRTYKMFAARLARLNIFKLEDFLYHIPFRYENYSLISKISKAQQGEIVTIRGTVEKIENQYIKRWRSFQKAVVSDETGTIDVIWFNQPFLPKTIKTGDKISLSGKIDNDGRKIVMKSPEYEIIFNNPTIHTGRLIPVYPLTHGVSSKWLRRQIFNLLENINVDEYLPKDIIDRNKLIDLKYALDKIHFPDNLEQTIRARERLAFDEFFKLQLSSFIRKKSWEKSRIKPWKINIYKKEIDKFVKNLSFELTGSQKVSIDEILNDLSKEVPMNRLLEGDVGSGKTVVATLAALISYLNGYQTAFMAPTEILANQHFKTISDSLSPFGIKVELATSSTKKISKNFDVLIGTHALIYKKVEFNKLGLIVIDEQQRFGVEQRAKLKAKAKDPHLLTMTATPIPRTVALTMYGDLDLSILSDMPKGRKLIKTWLVPPSKRKGAYEWIEEKVLSKKGQVFIVCPFIEESETLLSIKAATKEFERLKKDIFPKLRLGLLHGKMKTQEKNKVLKEFKDKKLDILVSTPVVEVGIDIPNATIMLIEEAERFGLAQLHQLRGRVGRGEKESFCLLFTQSSNLITLKRLKVMETTFSGAELSEMDLKLRGPGEIHGIAQHGIPKLKAASFSDFELIERTKKEAKKVSEEIDRYPTLKKQVDQISLIPVSPD